MYEKFYVYAITPIIDGRNIMYFGCFCSFHAISSLRRQRNQTHLKMRNKLCLCLIVPPNFTKTLKKP